MPLRGNKWSSRAEKIEKRLEEYGAGGLSLEAVGVGWLLIGVVMGTLPDLLLERVLRILPLF